MVFHTRGIVFNYIKYRETSIIVRIFTEEFGMQSYIVNGVRSSKSRGKIALYQPLTLLDMVVYHKQSKDLQRISEAKCAVPFTSIPFDPLKTAISIFLSETLGKSLRHEAENRDLFDFVFQAVSLLDHLGENIANFHLQCLLKASIYLGFKPGSVDDLLKQLSGVGIHLKATATEKQLMEALLAKPLGADIPMTNDFRRSILSHVVRYYQLHLEHLGEIKSMEVLKEVLN